MALRTHYDGTPMPQNCRCTFAPVTNARIDEAAVRGVQLALLRARGLLVNRPDDEIVALYEQTRPEAEAIRDAIWGAAVNPPDAARETVRRTFTPAEQRDGIWTMTDTEFNAELASAWDAGWHEHEVERDRRHRDPSHRVTRTNPYRKAP